jgi:ABC-type nitrate/sulfonate/bicarbonate transport system substrate-binding protein
VPSVEGSTPIDSLIVKPGEAATLEDLAGTTIGVKGKIPASVAAMLGAAGLLEGDDYQTVLLDGFDPTAHIAIESIVGFPGWKSNEPGSLERAGIEFDLFDPTDYDIPGSFGAIYTSRAFADANPTVVEDFMRATMRGLADAVDDPDAAVTAAMTLVEAGGNPNFLSDEGERYRWTTDAALIDELTPDGVGYAIPDVEGLQLELDTYTEYGLFGDSGATPDAATYVSDVLSSIYDETGTVIWPG